MRLSFFPNFISHNTVKTRLTQNNTERSYSQTHSSALQGEMLQTRISPPPTHEPNSLTRTEHTRMELFFLPHPFSFPTAQNFLPFIYFHSKKIKKFPKPTKNPKINLKNLKLGYNPNRLLESCEPTRRVKRTG